MSRVKGGVTANKRRKNILEETKGFRFNISNKKRAAKEAIHHANLHSFAHRKDKKNDFRRLWITRLNAALKMHGLRYNAFIKNLKDKNILLDRKVLSEIARTRPESFERFIKKLG